MMPITARNSTWASTANSTAVAAVRSPKSWTSFPLSRRLMSWSGRMPGSMRVALVAALALVAVGCESVDDVGFESRRAPQAAGADANNYESIMRLGNAAYAGGDYGSA